jgi:hypothetical protein
MSADAGTRLQRILSALPTIVGRGAVSLDEVRDAVGVDAPTLLDDLRALTERDDEPGGFVEAVHILFEPDRVSIRSPHFARPTRITLPELCALELGLAMLAASAAPGERAPIDGARAKIRAAIVALPESAARDDLWYASGPSLANEAALDALRAAATELRRCGWSIGAAIRPSRRSARCIRTSWCPCAANGFSSRTASGPRRCASSASTGSRTSSPRPIRSRVPRTSTPRSRA